jgi:hypothetical protein
MNKYNIGFSIKLPIPGQDYSNLETRFDWEEETDLKFGEALENAVGQVQMARVRLDKVGSDLQLEYKSLLEEQEARLEKAREEYLKLANKK